VLINKASLSQTVDAINAAYFDGRALAAAERGQAARWIAGRQGLPGAYGDTFAGFPSERARGIVLFTGERITSVSRIPGLQHRHFRIDIAFISHGSLQR
jgi:hypothetical protein